MTRTGQVARPSFLLTAVLALAVGAGVVVLGLDREHAAAFPPGDIDGGCYFDQSCDSVPGVIAGRRLQAVGWTVGAAALVLVGLGASTVRRRWWRWVVPALVGLTLVVGGLATRLVLLGGYVAPPVFACQVRGTCATLLPSTFGTLVDGALVVAPLVGCAVLAWAVVSAVRRT